MIAVIGDVHGCINSLQELTERLIKNYDIEKFVFIGDLVDRGPASAEVMQYVQDLKKSYSLDLLRGNHEDMMIDFAGGIKVYGSSDWLNNGGVEALRSIAGEDILKKLRTGKDIFNEFSFHLQKFEYLLSDIRDYLILNFDSKKLFLSHAGVGDFSLPPEKQLEYLPKKLKDIKYPFIWDREIDFKTEKYFNYTVVHGHTPVFKLTGYGESGVPFINRNKKGEIVSINVDTGCVYHNTLSALLTEDGSTFDFEVVNCLD